MKKREKEKKKEREREKKEREKVFFLLVVSLVDFFNKNNMSPLPPLPTTPLFSNDCCRSRVYSQVVSSPSLTCVFFCQRKKRNK